MRVHTPLIFLVSGAFFGIAFVFSFLYWCFVPAFILFLYGIQKETSPLKLFAYGVLVGTLHYAGSFYWVWSTFPIQWLSDASYATQLLAIGFYWVLTSLAMGISGGMFVLIAKKILQQAWTTVLLLPVMWVGIEVFRSFLFSVYSFGPGSFLNVGFSYGYLGYLLAEEPHVAQLAVFAGVYGLSYLAALCATLLYIFAQNKLYLKKMVVTPIAIVLVISMLLPTPAVHRYEKIEKKVIALESYFDHAFITAPGGEAIKQTEVQEALAYALQEEPDVVVLPEDVRLESFASSHAFFAWAHEQTSKKDIVIIDNGPAIDARGERVLRSYMYDLRTDSVYFFDKRYLVPQGEFISYLHRGILSLLVSEEVLTQIVQTAGFKPGVITDSVAYPEYLPGILFCFETMVPYGVKRAEHFRNPDFIVHPISHAWFTNPFSLEYQLDSMLRVSAIWNNIPIVSAGSMTESKLFLPSGEVSEGEILEESDHWKLRSFSL